MALGMKQLVAEARAQVQAVAPQQARNSGELILDVREPLELESSGRVAGAVNIPRGVLESRADPDTQTAEERLTHLRGAGRIHVLCGSGARAALAAHTLSRMGYEATVIEGGMTGWETGGHPGGGMITRMPFCMLWGSRLSHQRDAAFAASAAVRGADTEPHSSDPAASAQLSLAPAFVRRELAHRFQSRTQPDSRTRTGRKRIVGRRNFAFVVG